MKAFTVRKRNTKQQGFTLIEMLVIAPIVILAIGAFVTVIISMTGEVLSSRGANTLAYNIQDAVTRIEQDVKQSTSFLATNNVTLTASQAQGYNNDATNFTNIDGTSGASLILSSVVTTGNPTSPTAGIVYLSNQPNACASADVKNNKPMVMNIVYFTKTDTSGISSLWRRTIMPSNYLTAGCSTPWERPSCFPDYMDATPSPTLCKTKDVQLVKGVAPSGFNLEYFGAADATTANTTASTSTDLEARGAALLTTPTVSVSITASQSVGGRTVERSATLRATRLEINATAIANVPVQSAISSPPSGLTVTGSTANQVTLAWTAPSGTPTSYTLQHSQRSDFSSPTTISGLTTTSRTVTGLTSAKNYFFRVLATNSFGTTSYSSGVMGGTTGTNNWANYTRVTGVGDWNRDGKNDIMGYKANGDIELHLGNGDGTFDGIISMGNIGTTMRNFLGPGALPGGSAPVLFWVNTNADAYVLRSDGNLGVSGSPTLSASTATPNWGTAGTSVIALPYFYYDGRTAIAIKANALSMFSLQANGTAVYSSVYGTGWDSSFPGDTVFGAGRYSPDSVGDIIGNPSGGTLNSYNGLGDGTVASGVAASGGWVNNRLSGGWDYNSDGRADILRQISPSGTPLYFYSNNGATGINAGIVIN